MAVSCKSQSWIRILRYCQLGVRLLVASAGLQGDPEIDCWSDGGWASMRHVCCGDPRLRQHDMCFVNSDLSFEYCCLGTTEHFSDGGIARLRLYAMLGFTPHAVLDVGAHSGDWSQALRKSSGFTEALFYLVEANQAHQRSLEATQLPFAVALLTARRKDVVNFYVRGTGSAASVFEERTDDAGIPGLPPMDVLKVPGMTLDDLVHEQGWPDTFDLVKLDVQGSELEVLRGGSRVLRRATLVIMECSVLPINAGAPLLHEAVSFMAARGFQVVDVAGIWHQRADFRAMQFDVLFAQRNSSWVNLKLPVQQ